MEQITIVINATVATGTDRAKLEQRIADQIRKISSPVREDEGLTTVNSVRIQG